jgi:DNA-binding MarR family transcriptional regulator
MSVMRLARRLRNERADFSLSLNQLAVLATLDRHGPLTRASWRRTRRCSRPR